MSAAKNPVVLIPEYKAHYGLVPNYIDGCFVPSESTPHPVDRQPGHGQRDSHRGHVHGRSRSTPPRRPPTPPIKTGVGCRRRCGSSSSTR